MKQVATAEYPAYMQQARAASGDQVYPCSIAEGIQSGEIYTDGNAVLFHHYCGFAYLSGTPDAAFLREITERFFRDAPQPRRFVLITDQPEIIAYYAADPAVCAEKRFYFRADKAPEIAVPDGFSLSEITAEHLSRLQGRIIPAFSWESAAQFLQDDTIAACAFSSAVTSDFVDIGIETQEAFRRKGLAVCAAAAVMQAIIRQGKTPVWACHAANTGSVKTAQKLGFRQTHTCTVLRKREAP